ncbi:hypothetical protein BS47DRAFT_788982 [Hydnum rufescens UP504]|uniref:NACHT domain-containing protein n=1 Tax=Hydnum rufescens UP504 TaxID=1448309 RepID=A0A9P6ACV9_9AGAM|nr:hypothetical protein BS47DRAFT_788982 [Hydnum rufescens UP504]
MDRHNISLGLKDDVETLSKKLESISSSAKAKSSAGVLRRLLERDDDEHDLRTFTQSLKAAIVDFQLSQTLRQGQELFLEKLSVAILSLPRANLAAYDSGREDALSLCLEGTRVSILAEIMSWLERTESGTPPVYWLMGLAGIGKSTIAKTVAERADEDGILGGSFFFSQSDAPLRDPQLVFPTLAFQLAQSDNEFKNLIGEAIQQDATLGYKTPLVQFEGLILKPLAQLDTTRRTTLIVLDALDECEKQGAATILKLLLSRTSQLPFLRILITSRPEQHISSVFSEPKNFAKRILHDIEASVIEEDLRLYIRSELRRVLEDPDLANVPDWTEGEINALVEKSGKLFIYAATSIRFIGDPHVGDPRGHLDLILDTELSKGSKAKPYSQLDSLYMGVLRRSLSDSNPEAIVERFQTVVGSIVLLRQPLPLGSLARFVKYKPDGVNIALRHLRSVIIPPSSLDEAPHIYHPSFRDFITDPSRCSISEFVIVAIPDQELRHALRCIELMATSLRQDIAGISDVSLLNSEVEGLDEKVRDGLSVELQYACRYWASHLSRVDLGEKRMVEALEGFSTRSILMWLEVMSLIGNVHSAVTSMQEAHQWAMNSKCDATLITILADAYRFILTHSEVIRASALQVYHSALAFTPHATVLYETYSKDVKSCIRVLQGVEAQWPQSLSTLVGHSSHVTSVAFSPDGLRLVSGSLDCTLRLWDAVSGVHIATLQGHSHLVYSVAFSPDGLRVISGLNDCTLCLWDATLGVHIATLRGHSGVVSSVAFSPDGLWLVSGSWDHTLCLWNAMSGAQMATLQGHSNRVSSVAFSPDGQQLVSGSWDYTLCLWDAMSGICIATLQGHSDQVTSVAFSPDGLWLVSGSLDHTLCLWNAMSGAQMATLQGHSHHVTSVAFSPDSLRLVSGSRDRTLCLWDAMSGACIATLQGHSNTVLSVAFSPDGLSLASGSVDGTLCLWDAMSSTHPATLQGHSNRISSIALSPDGSRLASASHDCTLCLWDVLSGAHIATLQGHSKPVITVAFSPDGLHLASGSWDSTLCLWDAMLGVHIATLQGHSLQVNSVVFSPDGLLLASGSSDETLCLWDAMSGSCIATLEGHSLGVTSVAFSPDGLQLVSGSDDCTLCLWDAMSGMHIATLQGHSREVFLVVFSPNGLQVASGSHDSTICLWDATSSMNIATLEVDSPHIDAVAFSSDGHTLISQTQTQTFVWDLTSQLPQLVSGSILEVFPPTIGLSSLIWSRVHGWIQAQDSQGNHVTHICYIPPHYSPHTTAQASSLHHQSRVAVGCGNGHVVIVDPQDHPFVHRLV